MQGLPSHCWGSTVIRSKAIVAIHNKSYQISGLKWILKSKQLCVPNRQRINIGEGQKFSHESWCCPNLAVAPPSWRLPCRLEADVTVQIRIVPKSFRP